jgi:hypothetical protein
MSKFKDRTKNPRHTRVLETYPQHYTFYADNVHRVTDSEGLVHAVREAAADRSYRRETCCTSTLWHRVEPIMTVDEDMPVTCISCIGARGFGTP